MYELKIYRGAICHDNEEWYKIWRGLDLSVQNWNEEFDEFWPEHLKISKTCTLKGCFWPKHMSELKKVQRSYIWLHYRLIQNWKENWLVLSKMTWRISQIFIHRLKNSDFILERKMAELNKNIKFKTSRSTRCSVKNLFYLWNKWIVQLTKIFTHVLQNHCS